MWPFKKAQGEGHACSFCAKAQKDVKKLIAGPPGIFICDECVGLCNYILEQEPDHEGKTASQP